MQDNDLRCTDSKICCYFSDIYNIISRVRLTLDALLNIVKLVTELQTVPLDNSNVDFMGLVTEVVDTAIIQVFAFYLSKHSSSQNILILKVQSDEN